MVSSKTGDSVNRDLSRRRFLIMKIYAGALIFWAAACSLLALAADPLYDGRSLMEWRDLMNRIELRDPDSRRFVAGLTQIMDDASVSWITRRQAALTLGRLGPLASEAVPHVIAHLEDVAGDDPETTPRRWALSSLALFGRQASAAAPRLRQLLNDDESSAITRLGCLEALSQIGSAAPSAIPAIIQTLNDDAQPPEVVTGAVTALGMIGADAAVSVPFLMRVAQSEHEDYRREAARSLGRIGVLAQVAQPLLCDLLLDDDSVQVREAAMVSLGQTGPQAWEYIEALLEAEESEIRQRAATIVANWHSLSDQIVPALKPLLSDEEPRVRLAAAQSDRALTGRSDHAWPVLVELLCAADRDVSREASKELQAIVQAQQVDAAMIAPLRHDPRTEVRREGERLHRMIDR